LRFSSLIMGAILLTQIYIFEYDKGNRRGNSQKLYKRRSRLEIRKFVFGNRVTDKWNNLTQCCINCTTFNNFKSHLHKVLEPETK